MSKIDTPYYLIDERKLLKNLQKIAKVRDRCSAKSVLALKCFSTWSVFGLMRQYMDGTTSSSVYEARLGHETFGKEVHAYCVAYSRTELKDVAQFADKIIFNSLSQLARFARSARRCDLGLRLNPGISYSHFDLADTARRYSRLGVVEQRTLAKVLPQLSGVMFHCNCENADFKQWSALLDAISETYGFLLKDLQWVSLGGGIYFTQEGYPLETFCQRLAAFRDRFDVQVYLEPGESAVTQSAELVTTVVDIMRNKRDIAIVDASTEAHMLDVLMYRTQAKFRADGQGAHKYLIAGRSCLAGDVFGPYTCDRKLRVGSTIRMQDAAGYTMVKKNWFNGLAMPAIVVKRLNGRIDVVRKFTYEDFVHSLS